MSVGTVSVDGVQVAEVESFSFEPTVEAPVDVPDLGMVGFYHSITLPVSIRSNASNTPIRPCPKGRWSHKINRGVAYVVRGSVVGIVIGDWAMCELDSGRAFDMKPGRRRCGSKRWVERSYAEAWYREEMWFQRLRAMGWRTVVDMKAGG